MRKFIIYTAVILGGLAYTGMLNQVFTVEVSDMIYAGYDAVVETSIELIKKVKNI